MLENDSLANVLYINLTNKKFPFSLYSSLLNLSNRSIHICVTPNHSFDVLRRTFKRNKENSNKLEMTGFTFNKRKAVTELVDNDYIPRGGKWEGRQKKYFMLPAVEKHKHDHSGKDYSEKKDLYGYLVKIYWNVCIRGLCCSLQK